MAYRLHELASEDEARAKFAYFRKAEEEINAGVIYEPAPIPDSAFEPLCGTHAGYTAHYRSGTSPCRACREAKARYQRDYRAQRQAA